LVEALGKLPVKTFVVDGEIALPAFDDLLQRIHPAESRIRKLAKETPASLHVFDLLVDSRGKSLVELPLEERRERLEAFFEKIPEGGQMVLSPATSKLKEAKKWIGEEGLDGIVAKQLDSPYLSGERGGMVKVKRMRTADCVVGGFRWAQKGG
jgi:ATP-dependent DNA ligase